MCFPSATIFLYTKQQVLHLVDISTIGSTLDSSISILKRHSLCDQSLNFKRSTMNLGPLLSQSWVDGVWRWRAINVVEGTYLPMHHGWDLDWEDTLEECKIMGAMYVRVIVDSLNKTWFPSLHVSNTSKLVSDEEVFMSVLEQWLETLDWQWLKVMHVEPICLSL